MSHVNEVLRSSHKTQPAPFSTHNQGFYVTQPICQIFSAGIKGCNQWGDEDNWKDHQAGANVCSKQLCEKTAAGGWNSCNQNRSSKEGGAGMSMVPECFSTSETVRKFKKKKKTSDSTDSKSKNLLDSLDSFLYFPNIQKIFIYFTHHSPFLTNYTSVFYRAILPRCIPHHRTIFEEMVLTRH